MTLKPCCRFLSDNPSREFNTRITDLDTGIDPLNSEYFIELRTKMLQDERAPGCQKCYSQEERGNTSTRMKFNSRFSTIRKESCSTNFDSIQYIEMSIDNLCNLECRMCDSKFSTKLINRDKHLGNRVYKKLEPVYQVFDNLDITKLIYVKVLGGEPFISPNFINFLNYLDSNVNLSNIELEISTNGTTIPSNSVLDKLRSFNRINLNVSLDAYSKANDYQRQGSSYLEIYQNANKFQALLDNLSLSFHITVSLLTANTLSETINFLQSSNNTFSIDFVRDPGHLSLYNAPLEFLNWIKYQNTNNEYALEIIEKTISESSYDEKLWLEFLSFNTKLDKYYKLRLEDYNEPLYRFLSENYETYCV
jgi:organic radical activating enzyme